MTERKIACTRKFLLGTVAALLLAIEPAFAEPQLIIGAGGHTCSDYSDLRRTFEDPTVIDAMYFQWAQGFMTAVNFASLTNDKDAKDLSASSTEDQQRRLRFYCNKHPSDEYILAVKALYNDLPSVAGSAARMNKGQ